MFSKIKKLFSPGVVAPLAFHFSVLSLGIYVGAIVWLVHVKIDMALHIWGLVDSVFGLLSAAYLWHYVAKNK